MDAAREHLDAAAQQAQGGAQQAQPDGNNNYSPYSNPFGDRPPLRTSAGYAVRLSSSDLPSPAAFTPAGASTASNASAGTSPPAGVLRPWNPQLQQMQQPQQWQQQQPWMPTTPTSNFAQSAASQGGSNSILGADTPAGPGFMSPVDSRLAAEPWEGAGSSTKPPAGGVFEFQVNHGASRALASPDLRFAAEARSSRQASGAVSDAPSPQAPNSASPAAADQQQDRGAAADDAQQDQQQQQASDQKPTESGGDAPANSQASDDSMASRSSAASRERLAAMHSPSQLLKKAAQIMRSRAAVGGSSHIPLQRKQPALVTPMHQGIQAPATPNPTPATPLLPEGSDATKGHDQAASATPEGGRIPVDQMTPPLYKGIRTTPTPAQVRSPGADSVTGSIVSFGSHCGADVADTLAEADVVDSIAGVDAADSMADAVPRTPPRGSRHSTPAGTAAGSPGTPGSTTSPMALDKFASKLQDSETRRRAQHIFQYSSTGGSPRSDLSGLGDFSGTEDLEPIPMAELLADDKEADDDGSGGKGAGKGAGRAWGVLKRLSPLMLLLMVAGCIYGAMLGASVLPGWLPQVPGAVCDSHNVSACQEMYAAAFKQSGDGLVQGVGGKLQLAVLRAKWQLLDNWDHMVHGRMPKGTEPPEEQQQPDITQEHLEPDALNEEAAAPVEGAGAAAGESASAEDAPVAAENAVPATSAEQQTHEEAGTEGQPGFGLTSEQAADFEAAMLGLADLAEQAVDTFAPEVPEEQVPEEQTSPADATIAADTAPTAAPVAAPAEEADAAGDSAPAPAVEAEAAVGAEEAAAVMPEAHLPPQKLPGTCPAWLGLTQLATCPKDCWPAQHLQHKMAQSDAGFELYNGPGICYAVSLSPVVLCGDARPVFRQAAATKAPELGGEALVPTKTSTISRIFQVLKWVAFVAAAIGTGVAAVTHGDYLSHLLSDGLATATRAIAAYRSSGTQAEEEDEDQQQQQQQGGHAEVDDTILSGDEAEGRPRAVAAARRAAAARVPRIMRVKQSPAALHAAAALPLPQAPAAPPADDALLSDDEPAPSRRSQGTRRRSAAATAAATAAAEPGPSSRRRASASQQAAADAAAEPAVSEKAPAASGKAASGRAAAAASGGHGAVVEDQAEVVSPRAGDRGRRSTAGRLTVVTEERVAATQEQAEPDAEAAPTPSTATGRARRAAAPRRSSVPAVAVPEDGTEVEQVLASPTRRSVRSSKGTRASRG